MAQSGIFSTSVLTGKRVVGGKSGDKRIGKVHAFVFHPDQKRCVGFLVKRPDLALMFHRSDQFVAYDCFEFDGTSVHIPFGDKGAMGRGACDRLGIVWDACVLWEGMPVVTESGQECGLVGNIDFECETGKVVSVALDKGQTAKALLGQTIVPAPLIRGFRLGVGASLTARGSQAAAEDDGQEAMMGAILVDDSVFEVQAEGGLAEKAGHTAAKAQHRARQAKGRAKPKVDKAVKKTGEAINKGAFATGRQISRARGMFGAFKDEFDKAVSDDSGQSVTKKR